MEKIPGFRIVGGASEEAKEKAKEKIEFLLTDHIDSLPRKSQKDIERFEYPKTEVEFSLINFVNAETNRLRKESGMDPYDIPPENYHIFPAELYKKVTRGANSRASAMPTSQAAVFNAEAFKASPIIFGSAALHETLHLKGRIILEVEEDSQKIRGTPYRVGLSVNSSQKKNQEKEHHFHFEGLHEAVVSEQEKRSLRNMLDLPVLRKEKERLGSKEAIKLIGHISEKINSPQEDIIWVGEKEDEYVTIPYETQRKVLQYVCEEIQKQFSDRYHFTDDVFKEFLKAQFTGRLLPIARLVEDTFGEGGFRRLGDMKKDRESGILALEALREARIRSAKPKE